MSKPQHWGTAKGGLAQPAVRDTITMTKHQVVARGDGLECTYRHGIQPKLKLNVT